MNVPKPMTQAQLAAVTTVSEADKAAIEHAITESTLSEDESHDQDWHRYFRAYEVDSLSNGELEEDTPLDEFVGEAIWFHSGWEAAQGHD